MREFIAVIKIILFAIACVLTFIAQLIWRITFLCRTRYFYLPAALYYKTICFIFGIKKTVYGEIEQGHVIYLGNHLSYIDIPVLGSFLKATFISKDDVRKWPFFGLFAFIAETIFISRSRDAAQKCIDDIAAMLKRNRSLILFPEGTSTQGTSVYPFKSSLFEIFLDNKIKDDLVIQPFTLTILSTDGQSVEDTNDMDKYAWHGDMEFGSHLWQLALLSKAHIHVEFHAPRPAALYDNRKIFAQECHNDVYRGLINNLPPSLDLSRKLP